jgi:eukaryotic-like serine/threonine-protein kinase
MGTKIGKQQGDEQALPFLKRAVELDPNFAAGYACLGITYGNLGEYSLARASYRKAYELRGRASEGEEYLFASSYYGFVTGELEKANQVYETWAQAYPRDSEPLVNLAGNHLSMGQYQNAVDESIKTINLDSDDNISYATLISAYIGLNRTDEAKTTYEQALARNLVSTQLHLGRYAVAFLERDAGEMQRHLTWGMDKRGPNPVFLTTQSDTEAYFGHLRRAQELSRQGAETVKLNDEKERAALILINAALRESEVGELKGSRELTNAALALASTQDVRTLAALALARAGDITQAQKMAHDLIKDAPLDTMLNGYWIPTIRASIELNRKNYGKAVDSLQAASGYERGATTGVQLMGTLYPAYVRGEAFLKSGKGPQAAAEFQKLIDNRGVVVNFLLGALAHLQLARAYAMSGDAPKARTAYQDFLALWKDADPDIPILKEAKSEYARLQ